MGRYALLAIGYNRKNSMKRLLGSLARACYGDDEVNLIISIDNSGSDDVLNVANEFVWKYGEKKVVTYPERQGLRQHILKCGDFLSDYDAIAVFEDDVVASPCFYEYMKATVSKYGDNDDIAGISLYNHLWNVHVNMPFEPAYSQYDVYFMQFAQSWGQIWMKKQWFEFVEWYKNNCEEFGDTQGVPASVCGWPKSSWLKYHIKYCIEKNKYFVYPYKALSTCFADLGQHWKAPDTHLQVSMLTGNQKQFRLADMNDDDSVIYDAYFERVWKNTTIAGIDADDICVNLYGYKTFGENKRYMLSMKKQPYKAVCEFGLHYRPHELNAEFVSEGNDIALYDTQSAEESASERCDDIKVFRYRFRLYGKTKLLMKCIADKIKSKVFR